MSHTLVNLRALAEEEANALNPGDMHYRAFVGPPQQYDLMGAGQFNLLCSLGLRERHRVLDFGCGSLRLGRLLIPFLHKGNYYGIEPNEWLIEDAIRREITDALVALKEPTFRHNSDFNATSAGGNFDFIIAQSIFSHAGLDVIETALNSFRRALAENGLAAVTMMHPGPGEPEDSDTGWVYPDCVNHKPEAFFAVVAAAGLHGRRIPWFHPRQTWHVLARRSDRLPPTRYHHFLRGAVLNEPDLADSLARRLTVKPRWLRATASAVRRRLRV